MALVHDCRRATVPWQCARGPRWLLLETYVLHVCEAAVACLLLLLVRLLCSLCSLCSCRCITKWHLHSHCCGLSGFTFKIDPDVHNSRRENIIRQISTRRRVSPRSRGRAAESPPATPKRPASPPSDWARPASALRARVNSAGRELHSKRRMVAEQTGVLSL